VTTALPLLAPMAAIGDLIQEASGERKAEVRHLTNYLTRYTMQLPNVHLQSTVAL
jgi:hypothetical protein